MRDEHPLPGSDVIARDVRLHVVQYGRGNGLPLLLLHGLPTTSYLWRDVMRDLGHDLRTFAPDLLGLGRSERPARGLDLAAQAQTMLGLLDALALERVAVAGHDLGGAVAVHMAALAPDRIAGLTLIDAPVHSELWPTPPVLPLLVPGLAAAYVGTLRRLPRLGRRVLVRALGAGVARSELTARGVDHYLAPLLARDGAAALLRLIRAIDLVPTESAWQLLRAAPPPALVLWGADDHLHSASYGRRLAEELPGAGWVPVADAGHLVPEQRPERVAEELAAFVAEL